ncbi:MAG: hypothetical protein LBV67_06150, partial [Streptococcaceae bacterium]|nr:hypothetical protein [Streptococcaceae bacterium]
MTYNLLDEYIKRKGLGTVYKLASKGTKKPASYWKAISERELENYKVQSLIYLGRIVGLSHVQVLHELSELDQELRRLEGEKMYTQIKKNDSVFDLVYANGSVFLRDLNAGMSLTNILASDWRYNFMDDIEKVIGKLVEVIHYLDSDNLPTTYS